MISCQHLIPNLTSLACFGHITHVRHMNQTKRSHWTLSVMQRALQLRKRTLTIGGLCSGLARLWRNLPTKIHLRPMNWFYSGSNMKSVMELDKLVNEVILADDFDKAHLNGFNAARELK